MGSIVLWPHLPQGLGGTDLAVAHPARPRCPCEEAIVLQVVLDDHVGDGIKLELRILGVSGACDMSAALLGVLVLVQVLRVTLDVAGCLVILVGPCVVRNTDCQGAVCDLLEEVLLVEEEDDGHVCKPLTYCCRCCQATSCSCAYSSPPCPWLAPGHRRFKAAQKIKTVTFSKQWIHFFH